jgi:hypothetical protein
MSEPTHEPEITPDARAWAQWLQTYGAERFYMRFMENAQDAVSTCYYCGQQISLDIREGGGIADWGTDGDYGCHASPDTCEDGTGSHYPVKRAPRI